MCSFGKEIYSASCRGWCNICSTSIPELHTCVRKANSQSKLERSRPAPAQVATRHQHENEGGCSYRRYLVRYACPRSNSWTTKQWGGIQEHQNKGLGSSVLMQQTVILIFPGSNLAALRPTADSDLKVGCHLWWCLDAVEKRLRKRTKDQEKKEKQFGE